MMTREFRNTPKNEREAKDYRLPAIVPIVLYNGPGEWTAVESFKECLQGYEHFGEYVIDFKYFLFDLNRTPESLILSTGKLLDMIFALDRAKQADMERIVKLTSEKYSQMSEDDQEELDNWIKHIWLGDVKNETEKYRILSNFKRGEIPNMISGFSIILQEERQKGKEEAKKRANEDKIKIAKSLLDDLDIDTIIKKFELTTEETEILKSMKAGRIESQLNI